MMGHFPTLELPYIYICNDLHINLYYKNNVFYEPFFFSVKELSSLIHLHAEVCVTERSTPRTPDLEFRGSSLACLSFSLDKKLYSILSLFTQVYKWVPATYCQGVTLQRTSIPSRGE